MLAHNHEGLVFISAILEPIKGNVSDHICSVSNHFFSALSGIHGGVVIGALPLQHFPEIKSCGITFEVPFPDHGGLITLLLQKFGECLLLTVKSLTIGELSVQVAVFSGQNYRPAWSTY